MSTGNNSIFGFKLNPNPWGSGAAVLCGAGDGVEVDTESLRAAVEHIENVGVSGQGTQLPGALGNRLHAGQITVPMYFRSVERLLASVLGTVPAPSQIGGSAAYSHPMNMKSSHKGIYGTLVAGGADHPALREWPHVKVAGVTIDAQKGQMVKCTFDLVPYDLNMNEGASDPDKVVTAVEPADGALTIAAQPDTPSQITITVTDGDTSITELVATIVGLDRDGNLRSAVYTLSSDGLSFTTQEHFKSVVSITISGLAGSPTADTITAGVLNGINQPSTYTSISLPTTADRQLVLFAQMEVLINDQDGPALSSSDEQFVDTFRIQIDLQSTRDRVTSRFGSRIDEPESSGFKMVTGGLNFPSWDSANHKLMRDRLTNAKKKARITFTGPEADSGNALELALFLNNIQFTEGSPNMGGPGEMRLDMNLKAHRALASPAGLPAWADTQPVSARLVNLATTAAI